MKAFIRHLIFLSALIAVPGWLLTGRVSAQTFAPLYSLNGTSDGSAPGALILSGDTLYGTTSSGGSAGAGTVFKVGTNGLNYTLIYTFTNGSDGESPGNLVLSGNTLYGTAGRGSSLWGTLFAVNTDSSGFTNIYNFTDGSDGSRPSGLIMVSNLLFGTASQGGSAFFGTIFEVNTDGSGFTPLHPFAGQNNDDGSSPDGGLLLVSNILYGATADGGPGNDGTLFKINADGSGYTNFYNFQGVNKYGVNTDGAFPLGGLVLSGNTLYGTADGGSDGEGTVYAVNTDGSGYTNLFTFTDYFITPDFGTIYTGYSPNGGLVLVGDTLYGTTRSGGTGFDAGGAVFSITTNGTLMLVRHLFTPATGANNTNTDGAGPTAGLLLTGNVMYGTTSYGGTFGKGVVFDYSPTPTPVVITTATLPAAAVESYIPPYGVVGSQLLLASGGQAPYTWTNVAGTLPPGIRVEGTGIMDGIPTTIGTYYFTVQAMDVFGATATQALSILVSNADTLTVTITNVTPGMVVSSVIPQFEVEGTAIEAGSQAGNVGLTGVYYSVNNSAWTLAGTVTVPNYAGWTGYANLVPGLNTVAAYAVDTAGTVSATNTTTINYVVPSSGLANDAPGTPITTNWNSGGNPLIISEGGGYGVVPIRLEFFPNSYSITALSGDVVFLLDPNGGNNRANWEAVVNFFNPADPNGTQDLPATEYQTYYQTNPGPNYFASLQLFPRVVYVTNVLTRSEPGFQAIVASFDELGPVESIHAGQLGAFEIVAEAQPSGFTATITSPGNSGYYDGPGTLTITGITTTTNGQAAVTNVFVQYNGGGWISATQLNGWTNWSAAFTASSGPATVSAYAVDQNGNVSPTNSVTFTYYVEAPTDVSLTASAAPEPVAVGGNLVYSITVSNAGPATASGLVVSNQLPANVTFVSATGGFLPVGNVLSMNIGALNVGESNVVQVVVQPTATGLLTNVFQVYSLAETDPNPANNAATVVSTVTNGAAVLADVRLTAGAVPEPVGVTSNLTYSITVSNAGPATATSVVISNQLPASVNFVSATGGATPAGGVLLVNVGSLALGATDLVQVVVQPTSAGKLTNLFEVFASQNDPVPANNSATVVSTVTNAPILTADMSLSASAAPNPVGVGSNLVYSLTITNHGPSTASGVVISNQLPAGVSFVSATGGATPAGGVLLVNVGSMISGAIGVAQVTVQPTSAGKLTNLFEVFASQNDPVPANNSATVVSTVTNAAVLAADLSLRASLSSDNPSNLANSVSYAITVSNAGPATATGVVVSNQLPAGFNFVLATGGAMPTNGVLLVKVGSLAAGATNTIEIAIVAPQTFYNFTNVFRVFADQTDPDPTNNSASVGAEDPNRTTTSSAAYYSTNTTIVSQQVTNFSTELIAKMPDGTVVYDQTFKAAFLDSTVQAAVTQAAGDLIGAGADSHTGPIGTNFSQTLAGSSSVTVPNSTNINIIFGVKSYVGPQTVLVGSFGQIQGYTFDPTITNYAIPTGWNGNPLSLTIPLGFVDIDSMTLSLADIFQTTTTTQTNLNSATYVMTGIVTNAPADLSLAAVVVPEPVAVGNHLTFTIAITNHGPSTATDVTVSNRIPANASFVSATGGATPAGGVLLLNLGTLASNATTSAQIVLQPIVAGQLTNVFGVFADQADPVPSNNVAATVSTVTNAAVVTSADVSLSASAAPEPVGVGGNLVYSLTVSNAQLVQAAIRSHVILLSATDVTISNRIPAGATFVSATGGATPNNGVLLINLGSLGEGTTTSAQIIVQPTLAGQLTNVFTVFADQTDYNPTNNYATVVSTVTNEVTLRPLTVTIAAPVAGQVVSTATFTVTGTAAIGNVVPTVTVKPTTVRGAAKVRPVATPKAGPVDALTNVFVQLNNGGWFSATPANGWANWSAIVTLTPGSNTVRAYARDDYGSVSPTNAVTFDYVTNAAPLPVDVALNLMAAPNPVAVGDPLTYSLTVTNNSSTTATGVVVSNTLPAGVTFISALPSQGSATNQGSVVTYSVGNLPNGNAATLAIIVIPNTAGLLTNKATAYSAQTDSVMGNNRVTNVTTAVSVPITNLVLTVLSSITLNKQTGLYEQQVEVSNGGPATPSSVLVLVSGLSANATLYNATGKTNGLPYVQSAGPLGVGSNVVFLLEYYVSTRVAPAHLTLTVEAGPSVNPPVITGTVMSISRTVGLANGSILVEFASIPGRIYAVQYSSDMNTWQTAVPVIAAANSRTQWIDAGPPQTSSNPASQPARYYRVVLLPAN